ncbi:MAG: diaminopropionate ammonia-lyase [Treponema sp.]|nr:diaminopropionate ammonia-lyase [Treponema sp.]
MSFEIIENPKKIRDEIDLSFINEEVAKKARNFHSSFPQYKATPLHELSNLATELGVKNIFIKDESFRFGLNAFKVLGGSYAIGNYIAEKLGNHINEVDFDKIISKETKEKLGKITFISATDGNHGRGVAWTANQLKQSCIIYMPKGSTQERLNNIKAENADASITDFNYDDAVRLAAKNAKENGWVLVQDTSWPGYEKIPTWIIQGYSTLALEVFEQLKGVKPTHIFLQAGVGSFATAMIGLFSSIYKESKPIITVVEPNEAACIFKTIKANDGKIHPVTGNMKTIMAGLACGEPVTVGIDVFRNYADFFASCPDYFAADGMRVLATTAEGDPKIVSGESGAAAFGCAYEILSDSRLSDVKEKLEITKNSVLLFISTEGNTDKENYKKIVWNGEYSNAD